MQIVCPHCSSLNRIPDNRSAVRANCGKCHKPLFGGSSLAVSASMFERHLTRNEIPLVVDFWAPWCGPCKSMAPAFEQAAARLEPATRLLKVNTESEQNLATRYAIKSIPTLIIFSAGKEVTRLSGALDLNGLVSWVNQHI